LHANLISSVYGKLLHSLAVLGFFHRELLPLAVHLLGHGDQFRVTQFKHLIPVFGCEVQQLRDWLISLCAQRGNAHRRYSLLSDPNEHVTITVQEFQQRLARLHVPQLAFEPTEFLPCSRFGEFVGNLITRDSIKQARAVLFWQRSLLPVVSPLAE
jgi:hypothetical protein